MAKKNGQLPSFAIAKDDPLATEHRAVAEWVEEAFSSLDRYAYSDQADLKSYASGRRLFDLGSEEAPRYVSAALAQCKFWDQRAEEIRSQAENELACINAHHLPGWNEVWGRRQQTLTVIATLLKRKLRLTRQDILELLIWCRVSEFVSPFWYPLSSICRAVARFVESEGLDDELRTSMQQFAKVLRASTDKQVSRLATSIDQLAAIAEEGAADAIPQHAPLPPPTPGPAGHPGVLRQLKQVRGMMCVETDQATSVAIGPDRFLLPDASPLEAEHGLLSELLEEVSEGHDYYRPALKASSAGRKILQLEPDVRGRVLLAATERHVHALLAPMPDYSEEGAWQSRYSAAGIVRPLAMLQFSLARDGLFDLLLYMSMQPTYERLETESLLEELLQLVEHEADEAALSEGERYVLSLFRASLLEGPALGSPPPIVDRLTRLIGDGAIHCLGAGEVWSDAVNKDYAAMPAADREAWTALWAHLLTATSSRPSNKWLKTATQLAEGVGLDNLHEALARWLPLVPKGRSIERLGGYLGDARGAADTMIDENATCLRGLLWLIPTLPCAKEIVRHVAAVAMSAYKKVPGVGPRAVKVGNAAVYALSQIADENAVGQLAMLKVRVKFGTAQKEIEKAYNVAAEALGLPRDQIEEMGVPSYGLESMGHREEKLGDYTAELVVSGSDAALKWFDSKGKALKSVPTKVRKDHKEELKELQQSLKDIQGMLPAQRDRIDSLFLAQKSWPIDQWRERYLNHPLVGTIASRLLWCVDGVGAHFIDGQAIDVDDQPIEHGKTAEITLWHPVGRSTKEITAWRQRLESLQLTQPFKQAHREVYLLTDAERNTGTYSNRYAAHVLRQHQFNALCLARGWKNRLRLMVDDFYPPACKELPNWGLRAEFWVEGIGDDYGNDTNESGVYLRLATDQVRFYRFDAAVNSAHAGGGGYATRVRLGEGVPDDPLTLDQVPELVFSEIMRDIDLFVGVASVGNDPTWQDGGPEGRHREYWNNYSFGELSGTAATRREVLQRLVPRLKIADLCSFSDRFLVVEGKKRTYKIHLGSGNILMEPNDQYLCIVPDARSRAKQDDLFLPFEGDNTLSIIISKAFLLAEDTKIKDRTILAQIDGV